VDVGRFVPLAGLGLLLVAGGTGIPASAQRGKGTPAELEPFLGGLTEARAAASERNVPLVVFVIQEGEEANDRFYASIWSNPKLPAAVQRAVVLLSNDGTHETVKVVEVQEDGTELEREICARFRTPTCEAHRRNWDPVFQSFHKDGEMRTPQTICVLPDGVEQGRLIDVPDSVKNVATLVLEAQGVCGPGLTAAEHRVAGPAAERGRQAAERGEWAEALRNWNEVLTHAPGGVLRDEAEAGVPRALEGLHAWLDDARRRMEEGDVEVGYGRLVALRDLLVDTPLERDAKRAVLEAERRKEWKDRIKAWKRERAAEEVVAEIEEHLAANEEARARQALRRLLKKYSGTETAAAARVRWAKLLDDGRSPPAR
jgi:hypothetical protein